MHFDLALMFLGMWIVTFFPRWLPIFFLSNRKLPEWLNQGLEMIPVALLSAIVFPTLFITDGSLDFSRKELLAAAPTLVIAYMSRSLIGTILGGMLVFWLVGKF